MRKLQVLVSQPLGSGGCGGGGCLGSGEPVVMAALGRYGAQGIETRLAEVWSATRFEVTQEMLASLTKDEGQKFLALEPQVRLRLVLATLQTVNSSTALSSAEAQQELQRFAKLAEKDEDDWVRLFGHAVEDFNGRVSIKAMAEVMPSIKKSLEDLEVDISAKGGPKLESFACKYLGATARQSSNASREAGKDASSTYQPTKHFRVKEGWQPDPLPSSIHSAQRSISAPLHSRGLSLGSAGGSSGFLPSSHKARIGTSRMWTCSYEAGILEY